MAVRSHDDWHYNSALLHNLHLDRHQNGGIVVAYKMQVWKPSPYIPPSLADDEMYGVDFGSGVPRCKGEDPNR